MGMTRRTPAKPAKEAKKASKQTKTLAKDSKVVRQKVVRQKDPVGFMVRYLFVLFIVLGVTRAAFGPFPLEKRMWAKRADFLESWLRAGPQPHPLPVLHSRPRVNNTRNGDDSQNPREACKGG